MSCNHRWIGAIAVVSTLSVIASPVRAQFYGGGFWGGGGHTVAGSNLQGAGVYAMGAGRYNVETAQANAIDANTAMRWNQYIYNSRVEGERIYHERMAKDKVRGRENAEAVRLRLRNSPNSVDIERGDALNVVLNELNNPKVFARAVDYGDKVKIGGETIRDIPFQYASAAISTSVHQLVQGGPPSCMKRAEFNSDREKLRGLAAEVRKEAEEQGTPKPETIKKAKDQIMATKAKAEATFPKNSQDYRDAQKYIKALYGLASMLETPAVNLLLAGVEKHPDATLGELLTFMTAYNLRFGAAQNPRQREVYMMLYPKLVKLRDDVAPGPGTNVPAPTIDPDAPGAVFDGLGYNHAEGKGPRSQPPR